MDAGRLWKSESNTTSRDSSLQRLIFLRAQVKQKVRRGLVVAYSPSSVSQIIAHAIMQVPAREQKRIMDRFVQMKQRELGTVIVSVR
jgi:hypothetical protein